MVEKVATYSTPKNILIGQESYSLTLPAIIKGTAGATIKAGQPLVGDLEDRDAGFTAGTTSAVCANLHDVVIGSNGYANGTIVIVGCIDGLKLDSTVLSALKTADIDGIVVVKGSAI